MSQVSAINRPDVESVLAQMRMLRQAATGETQRTMLQPDAAVVPDNTGISPVASHKQGFGVALRAAIQQVNAVQLEASTLREAFVRGESQDLVKVMIAGQKSEVAFQAVTQVRNRLVSAYQDIMNMPI